MSCKGDDRWQWGSWLAKSFVTKPIRHFRIYKASEHVTSESTTFMRPNLF